MIVRYFLLVDGKRGNPEGMPNIMGFLDLQDLANRPVWFAAHLVERLRRNRSAMHREFVANEVANGRTSCDWEKL